MNALDILWGGNNKCEVTLIKNISISEGSLVELSYDYIQERYLIKYDGDSSSIYPTSELSKITLDNIFLAGSSVATLTRVVDMEELNCILEIKVFISKTYFNTLQSIKIYVDENVISKMRIRGNEDVVKRLKESFMYENMVFVKGYGRKGASFTLLSKDHALNIIQENSVYTATNIVRYDKNKADFDAVHILSGNIEFVNSSQNAVISNAVSAKINQIVNGNEYLTIWDAYNDLERFMVFKQATENGILEYSSYKCELTDAFEYRFKLVGENFDGFSEDSQIDCTEDNRIMNLNQFLSANELQSMRTISVGVYSKIKDGECIIVDRRRSAQRQFPSKGFLFNSIVGDSVRLARREEAKKNILSFESPMHNLALIIDKGIGNEKQTRTEAPITQMLQKRFGKNYEFNLGQKRAIEVAINTPDIALILGPPGTGKTTVIKAIVSRFEEYYKKNNGGAIPNILITSFQHEAVENAILNLEGNGLPPNRIGGKRSDDSKQTVSLREWSEKVTHSIEQKIEELGISVNQGNVVLRDKIFAWINKGRNPTEGIEMMEEELEGNRNKISSELLSEINKVLAKSTIGSTKTAKVPDWEKENINEIEMILQSQRLTQTAYNDDGKQHAIALKFAIIQNQFEDYSSYQFIDDVLETKAMDITKFNAYVFKVNELKSKYILENHESEVILNITTIEQCLKKLESELCQSRLNSIENIDEALAYVLNQYIETIQDEKEVNLIVEKYSNINAATCQQSMEIGRHAQNQIYDLVIVDEAARANPLDLLIPMSMGKQIVLVGDHKQLPHMLDPDVTKQFENNEKINELGILKVSLFERLYNMFESQSGNIKRTSRLKYQYRMNSEIEKFVTENFYADYPLDSSYVDDETKRAKIGMYNDKPLVWLEANKEKYGIEQGKRSKYRIEEAELIFSEVKKIIDKDATKTIGIITFYSKQKEILQEISHRKFSENQQFNISIGTVDAFQGKEFDIVFLSCVRANNISTSTMTRKVGHISDNNRLCVSFTRARQLLVIVGDKETVSCVPAMHNYIKKCTEEGIGYFEYA